jgi:hypothetical protein
MINGLPSTGGIRIGGSNKYFLIPSKAFLAILSPNDPLIFAKQFEYWPTCSIHMRDASGDVVQSTKESFDLFLCLQSRHFSDGSDFVGIYFNTLLTNNKAQKLPGSDTEGTLIRIQTELVLSQPLKHLQQILNMFFFSA